MTSIKNLLNGSFENYNPPSSFQPDNTFITNQQSNQFFNEKEYLKNINKEIERVFVYIADESGYLKTWDLTYFIENLGVNKAANYPESKNSFNPKRKDKVD